MANLQELMAKYGDYQVKMRRHFHQHPEISCHEYETSKRVQEELTAAGIPWKQIGLETGVVAEIKGNHPGKTFMLRGDMDALEVLEKTGCDFASQNEGVMHACGHDCHTSMLLTAALMLNEMKDQIHGTVRLFFQPAEECAKGAKAMIAGGALDGVDACFGMHVWSDIPAGKVSLEVGPRMASGDLFKIHVKAKDGHGAQPHLCVDAVVVGAAIVQNLQTIVSRETPPTETAVVSVGIFNAGTRFNVIAGTAYLEGTTRCFNPEIRAKFPEQITRIASETAKTFGAEAEVEYLPQVPPTINDARINGIALEAAESIFGKDCEAGYGCTMGGEDFSYFTERVPGAMAFLGVRNEALDAVYPQHSNFYIVDESVLIKGAALYVQTALNFLNAEK